MLTCHRHTHTHTGCLTVNEIIVSIQYLDMSVCFQKLLNEYLIPDQAVTTYSFWFLIPGQNPVCGALYQMTKQSSLTSYTTFLSYLWWQTTMLKYYQHVTAPAAVTLPLSARQHLTHRRVKRAMDLPQSDAAQMFWVYASHPHDLQQGHLSARQYVTDSHSQTRTLKVNLWTAVFSGMWKPPAPLSWTRHKEHFVNSVSTQVTIKAMKVLLPPAGWKQAGPCKTFHRREHTSCETYRTTYSGLQLTTR